MFTLPGLVCLMLFVYLRPQEYYTFLQKLPLLYLFFAAAVGGLLVDLKLRLVKLIPAHTMYIAIGFWVWCIITIVLKVPAAQKVPNMMKLTIAFIPYVVMCQGVQSFRALRLAAGTMLFIGLFLAFVGFHQGTAPNGCMLSIDPHLGIGIPDGRPCETPIECLGIDAEPGAEYECQRIGLFGTTALDDRVRYRGSLQDPNELALAVCAALPFLFAFAASKRNLRFYLLFAAGAYLIFQCVIYTQSRGGMLVFLAVVGVYFVKRYGVKYVFIAGIAGLPLLGMGGRSGASADESTEGRYEAWRAGLEMLRSDPIFGVGQDMFADIHVLTAHNSYVLPAAELGVFGMILWVSVLYLSIKAPLMVLRDFKEHPQAEPARIWAMCVLGMSAAYVIQMMFLSLTYHAITWMYFGFAGAFYSTVKRHAPQWEVKFGRTDIALVTAMCLGFLMLLPFFLASKGF